MTAVVKDGPLSCTFLTTSFPRLALVDPVHDSSRDERATELGILSFCPRNTRAVVGNERPVCIQAGERSEF